jgi:hypothetical protein
MFYYSLLSGAGNSDQQRSIRRQEHPLENALLAELGDGAEYERTSARVDVHTGFLADLAARAGRRSSILMFALEEGPLREQGTAREAIAHYNDCLGLTR